MLPLGGPSRLARVLVRRLPVASYRTLTAGARIIDNTTTQPRSASRGSSTSSTPALELHFHRDAQATSPPRPRKADARPPQHSPSRGVGAAAEINSVRLALRSRGREGTHAALTVAQKYLYRMRKRSRWKQLYAEQYPDADMDAAWQAANSVPFRSYFASFEPKMATVPEDHPYVQAYSDVITAFLQHPYGVAAARVLLLRQLTEGVPLTQASALAVLEHMPVPLKVAGVLLPSPTSPVVLAATIKSAVREEILETPDDFRKIIEATLAEGGHRTEPEHWDWTIWASLIAAHVDDFRGAIRTLNEFKQIVAAAREEAIENGRTWPDHRADVIGEAYANAMHLWMKSKLPRGRSSMHSQVPALLAADLDALLQPRPTSSSPVKSNDETAVDKPAYAVSRTGTPVKSKPSRALPRQFLTTWLNAERFCQTDRHDLIWSSLSGQSVADTVAGRQPPLDVDSPSYLALIKCLKHDPPESYRPLAFTIPIAARGGLLAAVAIHPKPDLVLALALVNTCSPPLRPYLDPLYQRRRFDTAASAVVRAARHFATAHNKHLLPSPYPPFPHNLSDGRLSLTPGEWEWISTCIATRLDGLKLDMSHPPVLPLSSPRGSLWPADASEPQPTPENPMVVTHNRTFEYDDLPANKVTAFMPALNRVLCDAIVSEARHMGAKGSYTTILDKTIRPLKKLLGDKKVLGNVY